MFVITSHDWVLESQINETRTSWHLEDKDVPRDAGVLTDVPKTVDQLLN